MHLYRHGLQCFFFDKTNFFISPQGFTTHCANSNLITNSAFLYQRKNNESETEKMFLGMQQDEAKQVIIVMRSDSCLLQACKRCTEVQALPTSHSSLSLRHHNTASLDCVTLVWM